MDLPQVRARQFTDDDLLPMRAEYSPRHWIQSVERRTKVFALWHAVHWLSLVYVWADLMSAGADDTTEALEVEKLADELFGLVQTDQGYFYVSDGEYFLTKDAFFERVRGRLKHGRKAVKNMAAFLQKYRQ